MNSGYFSQNFECDDIKFATLKQPLFIIAQDFFDDSVDSATKLSFTVNFSNGHFQNSSMPLDSLEMPPYEHVTQVELKGISIPNTANDAYFVLDIPEFNGRLHSSKNPQFHETFAVVYYDTVEATKGKIKPLRGNDFNDKIKIFSPPQKRLNKFTIHVRKANGDIMTLGDIFHSNFFDNLVNLSFLFEFTIKA